ncbi:MAG: hypothetical protein BroJett025_04330 [Patescibacteria group bacterium]|nr:MAG: hypothetical protein BroJett025_04330 [Patescibacteria group bacterium]
MRLKIKAISVEIKSSKKNFAKTKSFWESMLGIRFKKEGKFGWTYFEFPVRFQMFDDDSQQDSVEVIHLWVTGLPTEDQIEKWGGDFIRGDRWRVSFFDPNGTHVYLYKV